MKKEPDISHLVKLDKEDNVISSIPFDILEGWMVWMSASHIVDDGLSYENIQYLR